MYSYQARVRYSETDEYSRLTPEGVLNYFQDCCCFHSEDLNIGIEYLGKNKLVWVVSSWQIVINRYPKLAEHITINTMPYEFRGCFGFRNFTMLDEQGELLAYANSQYSLLSTENFTPKQPPKEMIEAYILDERLDMEYAPRKIKIPSLGEKREPISVKPEQIDTNNHVNNGQYIRFAFMSLKEGDVVTEENLLQIRAQYKKAAVLGDTIYPQVMNGEKIVTISLEDAKGEPYAIVELKGKE
jgi:acyl-ACP thioesterase